MLLLLNSKIIKIELQNHRKFKKIVIRKFAIFSSGLIFKIRFFKSSGFFFLVYSKVKNIRVTLFS